ncbi:MAG TPA: DUF1643 domain-containing protein [Desulfotomaculum sp.]|nr:MAG: hypothetical protein JL56_02810 [Desulfotomaculum sp. BICA1-6]HBX22632.1 DUF1643 domain-containing protein [Desulfotomaculum sp.]
MKTTAAIDDTGKYRYSLIREWDEDKPRVLFIMLNPSTADTTQDDPTIRRCIGLAKRWGYGSVEVVNLFAYRSTDPRQLAMVTDPVGPLNDEYIRSAMARAHLVVAAWGTKGTLRNRHLKIFHLANEVRLAKASMFCLDMTKRGHPKHPLYISNQVKPKPYWLEVG